VENYSVRVTKDYLVFCSAHFISYQGGKCERLHGHNYRIAAEVAGPLDDNFMVLDFLELKRLLREIAEELDHRVMLPRHNPVLRLEESAGEVAVLFQDHKRWIFPREDCVILPIANTTAELIAAWIAGRLRAELGRRGFASPARIRVEVEEAPGQSARYEADFERGGG
jgi:6-pyruvoyltetrahydropterin/6-carboxytetrahydropterin synthase